MKWILVCGLTAAVAAQQGDPVVNMAQEPRHKVVFQSGTTRVHDVQIPAGDTSLYHVHDCALVYVPISNSPLRTQELGKDWSGGGAAPAGRSGGTAAAPDGRGAGASNPGRVTSTTSYVETPVTHRVGNIGQGLWRRIAVANLSAGSDAADDDVSGLGSAPEVVNRYYRAFRLSLPPGQATAVHKHAWPVVVVQQTAGTLTIEGLSKADLTEPGKFAFFDGTSPHSVNNAGTTTVEVIEVELRGGKAK